jgi:type I restriction enzyme S subunit
MQSDFEIHAHRLRNHFDQLFDTPTTIPQLRQTILQLAVQGQLVPQDPNDEPASALLSRVEEAQQVFATGSKARQRADLLPPTDDEQPFQSPDGWHWIRFGMVTNVVGGVTLGRKLEGRKLVSFPYLRVANVKRAHLELDVMKEVEIPIEELGKYKLEPGDLLLTEGGDWDKVGRCAIWRGEIENCLHQNHVFRARLYTDEILPDWLGLYANSAVGCAYFQNAAKQTTNLASINMTQLRHWPVAIPPLAEQKRIVTKVTELLSLCDALEAKLTQAESTSTQLLSAAVHHLLQH